MKVFVFGASNSIGPYAFPVFMAKELSKYNDDGEGVINRSIGASPSSAGLYAALTTDLTLAKLALIDFEINESGLLTRNLRSRAETAAIMDALLFHLKRNGVTPLVTILPTVNGRDRATQGEEAHIEAAHRNRVPFLNLASIFRRLDPGGENMEKFMKPDGVHIHDVVRPQVAAMFTRAFRHIAGLSAAWRAVPQPAAIGRIVRAEELGLPLVERQSSLRQSALAMLSAGQEIRLPIGADERLFAILLNGGALGGAAELTGGPGARVVKPLSYCWSEERPDAYFIHTADIAAAPRGSDQGLILKLLPAWEPATETTLHSKIFGERYGMIEIEGLIILRDVAAESVNVLELAEDQIDVETHIDFEDLLADIKTAAFARTM